MHSLNLFKIALAKLICVEFGKSELLHIHIFNWHKALFSTHSGTFWHLGFIRATGIILLAASDMVHS